MIEMQENKTNMVNRLRTALLNHAGIISIAVFFLMCVIAFALGTDNFIRSGNLLNILRQSAPLLIVAAAMTLVITTAGIDLSVGSTLALVGAIVAILMGFGWPSWLVFVAAILLGVLIGSINGYFIAYEGIPAFIVTLAMLSVVRGIALLLTKGYSIPLPTEAGFLHLGRAWFLGLPLPALIAVTTLGIGYVMINHTRFGRYVTGIGTNAEAVRRSGVNVRGIIMRVYILSSMAAALAGAIIAARLGSGSANAGVGFELEVIAAVVLGSTNLFGGYGTIIGTFLGAMTIATLKNGLILAHLSPFYTQIVTGAIVLLAIWLNTRIFQPRSSGKRKIIDG